jgi:short-subunit dehydrogenase
LFNNAGVSVEKPLDACQDMDWQWLLGVNVRGVGNTIAQFLPRMRASGAPCHIINTASMAGLVPLPGFGAYVASKYAVLGLSEVLHAELAGSDVGVSIVCPGVVDTHIFESAKHRPSRYDTATDVRAPASADVGSGEGMETDFDARYQRMLSPEAMAAIVLDGVRQDSLYILSHPEWQPLWDARQQQVTQAFKRCHHDPIKE